MTRAQSHTANCDRNDADIRLHHASKFVEVAELAADSAQPEEYGNVAASLAVLGGIAAADAACCIALGKRSRSQNHHDAEQLVAQIRPGGDKAALDLRRLLDLKDEAQYGVIHVSGADLRAAVRRSSQLLVFAQKIARL
jgi:hypothetical protein